MCCADGKMPSSEELVSKRQISAWSHSIFQLHRRIRTNREMKRNRNDALKISGKSHSGTARPPGVETPWKINTHILKSRSFTWGRGYSGMCWEKRPVSAAQSTSATKDLITPFTYCRHGIMITAVRGTSARHFSMVNGTPDKERCGQSSSLVPPSVLGLPCGFSSRVSIMEQNLGARKQDLFISTSIVF